MAKRKGHKVALQMVVAADGAVGRHDDELLVFRPPEPFDGAFVPLQVCVSTVLSTRTRYRVGVAYVDAPDQLARTAVDVDAGFGSLGATVGVYLVLIAVDGCQGQCGDTRVLAD